MSPRTFVDGDFAFFGSCSISDTRLKVTFRDKAVEFTFGDSQQAERVQRFLLCLDGGGILEHARRCGLSEAVLAQLVPPLLRVGMVVRAKDLWAIFHEWGANTRDVWRSPEGPETAYQLPSWRADPAWWNVGPATQTSGIPIALEYRSASTNLEEYRNSDSTSSEALLVALAAIRDRENAHGRYYSSAGALYPVELFMLSADKGNYSLRHVDSSGEVATRSDISLQPTQVAAIFVQQSLADLTIAAEPPIFVLAIDPRRVCLKYGSRGWSFAWLEVGQLLCRLEAFAGMRRLSSRAIGGLWDDEVQTLLNVPNLVPVLTVLIGDTTTA